MAVNILAAIRQHPQLKGNTFLIATEIAHRMSSSGYVRMAYEYIALKAHCCKRTAISQVARLVEEHRLFRKYVFHTKHGNAINLYQYLGHIPHQASPPVRAQGATVAANLSTHRISEAKEQSLREEIRLQKKGLQFLRPGSPIYEACLEKIKALEAMQRPG